MLEDHMLDVRGVSLGLVLDDGFERSRRIIIADQAMPDTRSHDFGALQRWLASRRVNILYLGIVVHEILVPLFPVRPREKNVLHQTGPY